MRINTTSTISGWSMQSKMGVIDAPPMKLYSASPLVAIALFGMDGWPWWLLILVMLITAVLIGLTIVRSEEVVVGPVTFRRRQGRQRRHK